MADENKITKIRVGEFKTGIRGLAGVMAEMAEAFAAAPDTAVTEALLNRLSARNYIPANARKTYGDAFLREFRKSLGQPFETPKNNTIEIKVLGPGCPQCDRMEAEILELLAETGLPADLEHVRDMQEIAAYGVMGMPALVVNGKVMCTGKAPRKSQLAKWLKAAEPGSTVP